MDQVIGPHVNADDARMNIRVDAHCRIGHSPKACGDMAGRGNIRKLLFNEWFLRYCGEYIESFLGASMISGCWRLGPVMALLLAACAPQQVVRLGAQSDACAEGYVWREAFYGDHVCVSENTRDRAKSDNTNAAEFRVGKDSDQCVQGLVWRLASEDDHVCVPQLTREQTAVDNRLASSRLAASPSPEPSPLDRWRAGVPLPPAEEGCHIFSDGKWGKVACASPEETQKLRRPVPFSIQSKPRWISVVGRGSVAFTSYALPLAYGSIDIDVISDPTKGTVTDVLDPGSCTGVTSHQETADSFSVQLNSNVFTAAYGNTGWVQFVEQRTPGQSDALCVWKVDVTVANATGNDKGYEPVCVSVPIVAGRAFLGATAVRDITGHAHVEGLVQVGPNKQNLLTVWGGFSSDNPCCASITTPDTVSGVTRGLSGDTKNYNFGFAQQWTQVTGDIYGTGCGSRAVFSGAKISERLTASTCITQPNCDPELTTQFSLSRYATPVDDPQVTGESNNLLRDSDFFNPSGGISRSIFKCISPATCKWWGNFHSPK